MRNLDLFLPMKLSNGLTLSICDHTRAYFGDYHLVKLEIVFSVAAVIGDRKPSVVDSADQLKLNHNCFLERMGVHSSAVEGVKNALLKDFETNSSPYMSSPEFLQRLLARELSARKVPARKFLKAVL